MRLRGWLPALASVLLLAACASTPATHIRPWIAVLSAQGSAGCVNPRGVDWGQAADSADVRVGDIILLALAVPEVDNAASFPWQDFVSSDDGGLVPAPLCATAPTVSFGLPVRYSGFTAIGVGSFTLTAALSPDWHRPSRHADQLGPVAVRTHIEGPSGTP